MLFNFQGASRRRFLRQLEHYITSIFPCQYFFKTFFEVFFKLFQVTFEVPRSLAGGLIIPVLSLAVNTFLTVFSLSTPLLI